MISNYFLRAIRELCFFLTVCCALCLISAAAQDDPPILQRVVQQNIRGDLQGCPFPQGYKLALIFDRPVSNDFLLQLLNMELYEILRRPQPGILPYKQDANNQLVIDEDARRTKTFPLKASKADCCEQNIIYVCPESKLDFVYRDKDGNIRKFQYTLILEGVKGSKYEESAVLTVTEDNVNNPTQTVTKPAYKTASYAPRESKGRDDSNVYLSGQISGANNSKPAYSADIKLRIPFNPNRPATKFLFDFQASSSKQADPDSLNIGVEISSYFPASFGNLNRRRGINFGRNGGRELISQTDSNCIVNFADSASCAEALAEELDYGRPIDRFDYTLYGKIESDRDFDNTNLIGGGALTLPIYVVNRRSSQWTLDPFIGFDFGRNLKSPVAEAEGKGIARPFAGASTFIGLFRSKAYFPVGFEANYTQRWLLARELKLEEDDDGELTAVFFSRKPRFFADAKLNFQLSPFISIFTGFEYGEKPPVYKLVDKSFKVGLTYKFRFKRADER